MKNQTTKNKLERKDWKDYELQILKVYREKYPKRLVLDNQRIKGRHSRGLRQIDVIVYKKDEQKIDLIIECKNLTRTVTVGILDAFYGKLHDLGIKRGIIVSTQGHSSSTRNYANSKGIILETISYEYLKDYYYIPPREIPEIFMKATRYAYPYCNSCDIRALYEIGEVYGMAEHEPLNCPKCKVELAEVRSDSNHRIIKIFKGKLITEKEIDEVVAKHIHATTAEWACHFHFSISADSICFICKHAFCEFPPTRSKTEYANKYVCSECLMSQRTLLLDYKYM